MKYSYEDYKNIMQMIYSHVSLLLKYDSSLSDEARKFIGSASISEIDEQTIRLEYTETWRYGGYEDHYFNLNTEEVFSDDPISLILARSKKYEEDMRIKAELEEEQKKLEEEKRICEQEQKDLLEYERLKRKFTNK